MKSTVPLAIVGNGAAAAETVLALRAHGYDGELHLFSENRRAPYNPMLGTYLLSGSLPVECAFPFGDARSFYGVNRVEAHLGQQVVALDAAAQRIDLADGSSYRYERCLVASGARPSLPLVAGLAETLGAPREARRVFTLRTLDDALDLRAAVESLRARPAGPGRAAVLGASFVGVKVAEALRGLGFAVCFIERESSILPLTAHPECAQVMQGHLRDQGYELRLGASLSGVEVGAGAVRAEIEGEPMAQDFDLLVVCTGTRPSLGFLQPGQVEVGEGILVDETMRSSVPSLYAAGDAAQGMNLLTGRSEVIGLWASARYQGRAAGRSLAGAGSGYAGGVPNNITHVGDRLFASIGCFREYDQTEVLRQGHTLQVRVWLAGTLRGVNLLDCCSSAGVIRQVLLKAAGGADNGTEATWTSLND